MAQKNAPPVTSKELENVHGTFRRALEIVGKSSDGQVKFRIVEPVKTLKQHKNPYTELKS